VPDAAALRAETAALLPALTQALGGDFLEAVSADDMDEVALLPAGLPAAVELLRTNGFTLLLDIGCTDHLPLTPRFEVSYHFLKIELGDWADGRTSSTAPAVVVPNRFRLRVFPDDLDPHVPSLVQSWPCADWPEREVWDLFGIRFDGHPDLRRILMPDDWEGHPLRKDYPLRGLDRRFAPGGRTGDVPPVVTK
jgi:NADH-quinone oxidoreductase subunit C